MISVLKESVRLSLIYFTTVFVVKAILNSLRLRFIQSELFFKYAEICETVLLLTWTWQAAQFTVWQLPENDLGAKQSWTVALTGILAVMLFMSAEAVGLGKQDNILWLDYWYDGHNGFFALRYGLTLTGYSVMPWLVWQLRSRNTDTTIWDIDVDKEESYCHR